jgi:hypothetical protein
MAYPDFTWKGVKEMEGGLLKVDNIYLFIYFNVTNWISSYGESALRQTKMAIKVIAVRTATTIGVKIVMRKERESFIILEEKEEYHDLSAPTAVAARCLQAYKCPWGTDNEDLWNTLSGGNTKTTKPWAYFWAVSMVAWSMSLAVSSLPHFFYLSEHTNRISPPQL